MRSRCLRMVYESLLRGMCIIHVLYIAFLQLSKLILFSNGKWLFIPILLEQGNYRSLQAGVAWQECCHGEAVGVDRIGI